MPFTPLTRLIAGFNIPPILALTDSKFTAVVGAIASVVNTYLILRFGRHVKKTRQESKQAQDDLLEQVKDNEDLRA